MNYFVIPAITRARPKPKSLAFVHPDRIKGAVMRHFDKPLEFFLLKSQRADICYPRQVLIYLLATYSHLTLDQIKEMVKKKHHTTIMGACEAIKDYMATDERVKTEIEEIVENF